MNVGSSASYRRAEGETTEWEDILAAKGIIPAKEKPEVAEKRRADAEEALAEARAAIDPLEGKTIAQLDELEEDDEYADSRTLDAYREKRRAELAAAARKRKFGGLLPLSRDDFVREVTEASREAPVVLLLFKDSVEGSALLTGILQRLSVAHRATKFLQIQAQACIEGYPDRNVPTVFVYRDGAVAANIVGLAEFGGLRATDATVEWVLAEHGALDTELDADPRLKLPRGGAGRG